MNDRSAERASRLSRRRHPRRTAGRRRQDTHVCGKGSACETSGQTSPQMKSRPRRVVPHGSGPCWPASCAQRPSWPRLPRGRHPALRPLRAAAMTSPDGRSCSSRVPPAASAGNSRVGWPRRAPTSSCTAATGIAGWRWSRKSSVRARAARASMPRISRRSTRFGRW